MTRHMEPTTMRIVQLVGARAGETIEVEPAVGEACIANKTAAVVGSREAKAATLAAEKANRLHADWAARAQREARKDAAQRLTELQARAEAEAEAEREAQADTA